MLDIIEGDKIREKLKQLKGPLLFASQKEQSVKEIIDRVMEDGDRALRELTFQFDQIKVASFEVSKDDIKAAYKQVNQEYLSALKKAKANIAAFHKKQITKGWSSASVGLRILPLERVGLYVPGGRAAYPSSVLMNAIPAKIAGVAEIIMVSPPPISPAVLVAAAEVGVDRVFQVGGAQAIAALAFGTETIPRVDKIVGPGNIYVTIAKKLLYGVVGIESLAGPSDILIIADQSANPKFIAADLLAQSEHDPEAQAVLVTNSRKIAEETRKQAGKVGIIFLVATIEKAIEIANYFAPEHLEIITAKPQKVLEKIKNAGAVFLGSYSPVAAGDYAAGPNHVLPTFGTARFSSPLGVYDFIKRQSVVNYTKPLLAKIRKTAKTLARAEGLEAHVRSIEIRFS